MAPGEDQREGDVLGKIAGRRDRPAPGQDFRDPPQPRASDPPRPPGDEHARACEEQGIADKEGQVDQQLTSSRVSALISPIGDDPRALPDAARILERTQGSTVPRHPVERRDHRQIEQNAGSAGDSEAARTTRNFENFRILWEPIATMPDSPLRITAEHDRARFERVESRPDPRLAGLVHRYAGYSHRSARPLRRREPAQDMVTLILGFNSPIRVSGPGSTIIEASSFVAALDDSYAITEERRTSHGMQVDLSPLGAYMLLGVPMRDLSEVIVPFEDVIGTAATRLVEQLFLTRGWEARLRLLDAFILARLKEARPPSADIAWAWQRLSETGGRLPISALAEELGCSRRHLTAGFREQVGPAPKTAARILRFARAKGMLSGNDGRSLAEIALGCGYYDQAHLNRDFRQMAGTTPSDFLAGQMPDGFGVSA